VVGGAGVDTVTLGVGPDRFTTGGGADVINIAPTTDTAIATGFAASTAVPTTAVGTTGMDIITGFSAGAKIDLSITTVVSGTTAIVRNGGSMGAATAGDVALIRGTYSSSASTFTASNSGDDSMFVYDNNGTTAAGAYNGVVLVGYVDTLSDDTLDATGIFLAV